MADQTVTYEAEKNGLKIDVTVPVGTDPATIAPNLDSLIDMKTGAPPTVREFVGGSNKADRLANLKISLKNYYGKDIEAQQDNDGRLFFTNPDTGTLTAYNEDNPTVLGIPIPTAGDLASVAPEIARGVGGVFGGIAAAPSAAISGPFGPVAGVGLGASAGKEIYDVVAEQFRGRKDSRSTPQRILEAGIVAGEDAAGQVVGNKIGPLIKAGFGKLKNTTAGQSAAQMLEDFTKAGVKPTAGAVSGKKWVQALESLLSKTIGSEGKVRGALTETFDGLQKKIEEVAGQYNPPKMSAGGSGYDKEATGQKLLQGVKQSIDTFKQRGNQLFEVLDQYVKPDAPISINNTQTILNDINNRITSTATDPEQAKRLVAILEDPMVAQFRKGLTETVEEISENGAVIKTQRPIAETNYQQIKELRSIIGPKAFANPPPENAKELRDLYFALSDDMGEAATRYGGEKGTAAFNRANRYWSNFAERNKTYLDPLLNAESQPAQIINKALAGTKDGHINIRKIKVGVPKDVWDTFTGYKIREMGLAKSGGQNVDGDAFSVNTFLTNWNNINRRAKDALFGTTADPRRRALDRLARLSGSLKDSQNMLNTSNTSFYNNLFGYLTGAGGLVGGAVTQDAGTALTTAGATAGGTLAVNKALGTLMTSPKFINWLAKAGEVIEKNPTRLLAHINRLPAVAVGQDVSEDIKVALSSYVDALSSSGLNMPQMDTQPTQQNIPPNQQAQPPVAATQ
jgi:hypothetical protein